MSLTQIAHNHLTSYAHAMEPKYLNPIHVANLCAHLEAVESGLIKRLIIVMPPRHSKTFNVGEFFPAWYLGRNPDKSIIYATYGQKLADGVGSKVRNQLLNPKFNEIFPDCQLSQDTKSKSEFSTTKGGKYYAVGRGGIITGRGGNVIIGDDLLKDQIEAASETTRTNLIEWYKSTLSTRQQDEDSAIILMGTRWNKGDLIGWALKENMHEGWYLLEMPAWSDDYDALWPDKYSRKRLDAIKQTLGTYFWNALYMGRPSEAEGNIFKRQDWRYWQILPPKFDTIIQSWDMNFKEGNKNSFVCGQVWGKIRADYYLLAQYRKQIGFKETKRQFVKMAIEYPQAYKKLVENKANGPAIEDELKKDVSGIKLLEPEGSKYARAEAMSPVQESGNLIIPDPKLNSWVNDFIDECANFPNTEHDDQVDSMSQAINYLNKTKGVAALEKFLKW